MCSLIIKGNIWMNKTNLYLLIITLFFKLTHQAVSHLSSLTVSLVWSACFSSCFYFLFSVWTRHVITHPPSLSLCRVRRGSRRAARPSRLLTPPVDPTRARARTPPTSTSVLRRRCRCAHPIPCPRNYWPTWEKGAGQTCAPSALTCYVSQGLDSPSALQGPRPLCEQECKLRSQNLVG